MKTLKQNILGTFGLKGEKWLLELPEIINALQNYWHLQDVTPVDNMTYHYVAKAVSKEFGPVVLKIGCDENLIELEYRCLKRFDGYGAVKLFDYHKNSHSLLLQQAIPGVTLKSLHSSRMGNHRSDKYFFSKGTEVDPTNATTVLNGVFGFSKKKVKLPTEDKPSASN